MKNFILTGFLAIGLLCAGGLHAQEVTGRKSDKKDQKMEKKEMKKDRKARHHHVNKAGKKRR